MASDKPVVQFNTGGEGEQKRPVPQIVAEGDVALKLLIVKIAGLICAMLVFSMTLGYLIDPTSKDLIIVCAPIVSSTLSGVIGYIAGEAKSSRRKGDF